MQKIEKKKLNVWILQTGEPLVIDGENERSMRGMNLATKLTERDHNVLFFSSDFNHQKKIHRTNQNKYIKYNFNLSFQLIKSPGYQKNIGIKRLYDHLKMAKNLKKLLDKTKNLPDVVFIGYPPIEVAYVMGKWLKNKKIPYILDIKDQWPDLIVDAFPKYIRPFVKVILFPYYIWAKKTIRNAHTISSMSLSYINWSFELSNIKKKNNIILSLVSDKKSLNKLEVEQANRWCDKSQIFNFGYFNILFLGSLSQAFDFDTLIKCASELKYEKIRFIICGDGELKKKMIEKTKYLNNIVFTSWVNQSRISSIASRSNIAIAPYKNIKNFKDNIPNKIIDYLRYGLPILSPLGGEVEDLLKNNNVGLSYHENSSSSLKKQIEKYYFNRNLVRENSVNAQKLYSKYYEYDYVYGKAVDLIENLKK